MVQNYSIPIHVSHGWLVVVCHCYSICIAKLKNQAYDKSQKDHKIIIQPN